MAKAISEIKKELDGLTLEEQVKHAALYASDSRKGVQSLIQKLCRQVEKEQMETARMAQMTLYEQDLLGQGVKRIVGVDEVGRGPLAGPVVACAVAINDYTLYRGINDSKKVNQKLRESLYDLIDQTALDVAFGLASHEEIDELNILNATKLAMKRAIENLKEKPDHILIDAVKLDDINIEQTSIIKGDEKSMTIAAASIMAKVKRDAMMVAYDEIYPDYDFKSNKGYGTSAHYEGLNRVGISPIHRKSFVKDFL